MGFLDFGRGGRDKRDPMGVLVKICGINSVDAADAAVAAQVDFAGLVFHTKSPRNLELMAGARLADHMRQRIRVVALTADAMDDELRRIDEVVRPDFLQLHGTESPARVAAIRERFGKPVIKALAVAEAADIAAASAYETDLLLFDAKAPAGAARPGGHGAAFDWQLLRGRSFSRPWLLAGGLSVENVARAIGASGAPGVDVSSGVETAPGRKSPELIRAFADAARTPVLQEDTA
jgi:phosphoribosylanthranilate isomerase